MKRAFSKSKDARFLWAVEKKMGINLLDQGEAFFAEG